MNFTLVIIILFAPIFAFVLFRICYSYCDKPAYRLMIASFILGFIAFIPSVSLFYLADYLGLASSQSFKRILFTSFVVLGGVEEFVKFIVLRFFVSRKEPFSTPIKGIFYSIMISFGFVSAYNLYFILLGSADHYTITKGLSFTVVNIVLAIIIGFFVSFGRFRKSTLEPLMGLGAVVFFHGLYDFSLFNEDYTLLLLLATGVVFLSFLLLRKAYRTKMDEFSI